ncbi:DUF3500 domain-containing protein [Streptomyces phaeoluteigriseus]|uniref:DUF3500 domain-containing protein n=1 Tax=Streptomyces phaeoluteigriseus TaxID=114686 RepID=A0ABY4Z0C3_9ACTN|nr:DUF3500 domain-containing protein [Streptomyces phaeoluteigriseus]USQ82466.1 DUF3500 domain-containing protein [Streptomyces phaeoluteigriseus]
MPSHSRPVVLRRPVLLAACLSVALGTVGYLAFDPAAASASVAKEPIPASAARTGAGGANTAQVVKAANAFLATLSDEQKDTVLYDFDDEVKTTGWSNFPTPVVERNGLKLGDLTAEQDAAAMKVMEAALSEQGYEELVEIRKADDYLASLSDTDDGSSASPAAPATPTDTPTATATPTRTPPSGAPTGGTGGGPGGGGGGGGANFGSEWYYLSFFGTPSRTGEFTVQYGGHHAAYNITYAGDNVTMSPSLTAVEPEEFAWEGTQYAPLADKRAATIGAVQSLTADELAAAEIDGSFDDLFLGPGNDGPFPTDPEGVLVSSLTRKQQAKVTAMLRTWVDDLDEKAAARLLKKYVSEYDETYIGWSGGTTIDNDQTYVRLDGPSAWIEFSNQAGASTDEIHQHTIFRDETSDYGWE